MIGTNWHQLETITASGLADNAMLEVYIADKRVGLLKKDGSIFAFSATCPHASAPLCDGWLDAMGRIVCPLHKYRFDPANGRNTSGEGYKLKTYPLEVRDDIIYIAFSL
jgi:nitrite reductase/ring-hydroxylating ferredoxin subunit